MQVSNSDIPYCGLSQTNQKQTQPFVSLWFIVRAVGCDQGFHNYLFYKGGLNSLLAYHACTINVYKQGAGVVNNLAGEH